MKFFIAAIIPVMLFLLFTGCDDGVKHISTGGDEISSDIDEVSGSADGDSLTQDSGDTVADNGDTVTDNGDTVADNGDTIPDNGDTVADNGDTIPDNGDTVADNGDTVTDNGDTLPDNGDTTPDVDNFVPFYPSSCAEIRIHDSSAGDGDYTLYADKNSEKPWSAKCADMNSVPLDYLILSKTGEGYNFSKYAAGGAASGTDVTTFYTAVKINPTTFVVTTGDQRFATSSGSASQGSSSINSMPYGSASDCQQGTVPHGTANIDLTGTPFIVSDTFCPGGNNSNGGALFSSSNKVVSITGGGYCGWTTPCPAVYEPYNTNGSTLELSYSNN